MLPTPVVRLPPPGVRHRRRVTSRIVAVILDFTSMAAENLDRRTRFACRFLSTGACIVLAACSQQGSARAAPDAGTPSGQVVPLPTASTDIPACALGYAHPSACCEPAPTQSMECVEDSDEPFRPCGRWITFPDARSCCSVANPTQCTPASASETDAGNSNACYWPCGPGGFLPDDPIEDPDGGNVNCANSSAPSCSICCYGMFSESGTDPTVFDEVGCMSPYFSQGGPPTCGGV